MRAKAPPHGVSSSGFARAETPRGIISRRPPLVRMRQFLFFATALALSAAEPLRFASGPAHVALVELYTSEGCSSCPPAERWLAARRDDPGLWRDFVPIAFHVDYWNQLGWPDRFSTREFTQRQYALATAWGGDSVYPDR